MIYGQDNLFIMLRSPKFGSLAVYITTAKLKCTKISYSHNIRMAIPYRTAKFKSATILAIVILGSTAKFNSRQYFRLYGIIIGNMDGEIQCSIAQ